MVDLTAERLREQLDYDPETGIFTWRVTRKGVQKGKAAGGPWTNGYQTINLDGGRHLAARLAWLHVKGEPPQGRIKFKDGDPRNIRFNNLRLAWKPEENYQNFKTRHPGRNRTYNLRKNYGGMTDEQYMQMYVAQGGVCKSCKQAETVTRDGRVRWLCVDHCHVTGRVRGLLCVGCNTAIGYARDRAERLRAAAAYLDEDNRRHAEENPNVVAFQSKVN